MTNPSPPRRIGYEHHGGGPRADSLPGHGGTTVKGRFDTYPAGNCRNPSGLPDPPSGYLWVNY
jgi:hypothetical protein